MRHLQKWLVRAAAAFVGLLAWSTLVRALTIDFEVLEVVDGDPSSMISKLRRWPS